MPLNKKISLLLIPVFGLMTGCTKLDEKLNGSLTSDQAAAALGSNGTALLVNAAYADLAGPFFSQDQVFSLEENTSDESLVPTRGGDWDDNGVWRVLHNHTWNADHGQITSVFNNLNKINFDATNVLAFKPTPAQAAEAKFVRAYALYYLLDLYGQYPIRNPGDNLLNPPTVKTGADAINFIISELTSALADVPVNNGMTRANPDAIKFLLMKCYLQKGAFLNRAAPTFDAGDMQKVVDLGTSIISSGKYSYMANYFDNFSVQKGGAGSTEGIFAYPNTSGVSANHGGIEARWNMTLHYNSWTPNNPNAGWNGFSTISDFYNAFGAVTPTTYAPSDSLIDLRIGRRFYPGVTNVSGLRPGFLVGQQFNENGAPIKDRKGAPLAYDPKIADNMIETGANLEVTGIRVIKYPPDYAHYGGPAGNWLMLFRYPDVVLMVAEAKIRKGDDAVGALALINGLRVARGAAPVASMALVNPSNVDDPTTLLAERGRELYWESYRRTDLIRFGVYLKTWQYKPTDDPKNLVFPIPNQALSANPNLKQNPGY